MSWKDSYMICTNCGIIINKGIDISHPVGLATLFNGYCSHKCMISPIWNNPENHVYACSERCAEEAPKNWLSENPTTLYKNKFKQKGNYKSPNFEKG